MNYGWSGAGNGEGFGGVGQLAGVVGGASGEFWGGGSISRCSSAMLVRY